ncbi:MAG: hypothetical protein J6I66_04500 [Lachnospiraceae bacterium]|nr:hypothetical protein [Lachnospiraceae bacterium]
MEIALQNGFCELLDGELFDITAGGWGEFALATGGVLCIAASPIVAATGNIPGALILAGTGCGLIGSIA